MRRVEPPGLIRHRVVQGQHSGCAPRHSQHLGLQGPCQGEGPTSTAAPRRARSPGAPLGRRPWQIQVAWGSLQGFKGTSSRGA